MQKTVTLGHELVKTKRSRSIEGIVFLNVESYFEREVIMVNNSVAAAVICGLLTNAF